MTNPANAASREARIAAAELNALANLIERPPLDDVLLKQDVALRSARAIRVVLAALADEAASQPREALDDARALVDALREEVSPPHVFEAWQRLHNSLDALHDTAPTDQAQRGEVERIEQALADLDGKDWSFHRRALHVAAALAQSGKGAE